MTLVFDLFISSLEARYEYLMKEGKLTDIQDLIFRVIYDLDLDTEDFEEHIDEDNDIILDRADMLELLKEIIDRAKEVEEYDTAVIESYIM